MDNNYTEVKYRKQVLTNVPTVQLCKVTLPKVCM